MKIPPEITFEIFRILPDPQVERMKVHRLKRGMYILSITELLIKPFHCEDEIFLNKIYIQEDIL